MYCNVVQLWKNIYSAYMEKEMFRLVITDVQFVWKSAAVYKHRLHAGLVTYAEISTIILCDSIGLR